MGMADSWGQDTIKETILLKDETSGTLGKFWQGDSNGRSFEIRCILIGKGFAVKCRGNGIIKINSKDFRLNHERIKLLNMREIEN